MKDFSQFLFIKNLSQYKQNSIHSNGSKFAVAFCWLSNDLSYYVFSKNANG